MKYILILIALFLFSSLYNKIALKYNIIDSPNERSSHSNVTVRGGGIIVPISTLLWFIYSDFQFSWFLVGLIIISIISFLDDISSITFKFRLIIHFIALVFLFIQIQLNLLPWWSWIPIFLISVGVINAYNFMDGINGITGGYSIVVLLSLWIVNNYQIQFINNDLIYITMSALCVFSFYNFRPKAKCFAGDVGSISIAYIILFLMAKLILQSGNIFYILFLCVYGIDTILTLIIRLIQKENIFEAHRKHLYQLLANELRIPHLKIAITYSIIQLIISLIVILVSGKYWNFKNNIIAAICIVGIITFAYYSFRIHIKEKVLNI